MNKEIKFRAWDASNKKMCHWKAGEISHDFWDAVRVRKLNLMQYTCAKDKNGKEIYEGDIVERNNFSNKRGIVVFEDGMYKVECSFIFFPLAIFKPMIVLGNTRENPDIVVSTLPKNRERHLELINTKLRRNNKKD